MTQWLFSTTKKSGWAPFLVFCVYAVAAKGFNAYLVYPWLDIPTHFLGGVAITYFFLTAIEHSENLVGATPPIIQRLLAIGLTAIAAVVWEFLEFLSDYFLATHHNLGVTDTISDLFFGLLGATVLVVFSVLKVRFAASLLSKT